MQLKDVFCCIVFMVTVAASCVKAENQKHDLQEPSEEKRIRKRDATMLIDNFPMDSSYQNPKIIYRRISKISRQRYGPPKPKYGPPRPVYGPPKSRKPGKKYYGKVNPRYGPPSHKKRSSKPKPRYGPPKRQSKPVYGPPKKIPYNHYQPEVAGFGEPPIQNSNDYNTHKKTYGEPPVDSYGAPIKASLKDIYPATSGLKGPTSYFEADYSNYGDEYKSWKSYQQDKNIDSAYAFTKKHPKFVKPKLELFVTPATPGMENNEENLSYSDVYMHKQKERVKKPLMQDSKTNKPWKVEKKPVDNDEEIIIGGQYAEPPARYIPKYPPSVSMMADDGEFSPKGYVDPDTTESATVSPYVNYKNSNLAFNPQNLNDAFSIPE
ncbi:uncharacterized protein LOC101744545 [Bombyx mori]|uniref:Cuticle protein n=1 Tax=Bombyx mori TaxID=7091 RepID=A0A8R2AKY7_BOMMO|nr:proline-rich extensin-like protein EPR1 [Bombyx mori]